MKINLRRNLFYLLAFNISWYLRKITDIIIESLFNAKFHYIYLYLMTFGQMLGGLSIYLYHYSHLRQKKKADYFEMDLIYNRKVLEIPDGRFKKSLLIFFAGFFDFMEFIILTFYVYTFDSDFSPSIDLRFRCLLTIVSSLICKYALKFKYSRHHVLSLVVMSLFLCISIILEIVYTSNNMGRFIFSLCLTLFSYICCGYTDCIEKYLVEVNYENPFKIIMNEGICEFIFSVFYSIGKQPFKEITKTYEDYSAGEFTLLIFLFFLHLVFSMGVNAYKIYCNAIYSPMAKSLMEYILVPFMNLHYFYNERDFHDDSIFFLISEIICLIIDFFGCVYNEYIILFCCGLEHETKSEITKRSINIANFPEGYTLSEIIENDNISSVNEE